MSVHAEPRSAEREAAVLVASPWFRDGKRRIYVNAPDGTLVGWLDLDTNERSLSRPDLTEAFEATVADAVQTTPSSAGQRFSQPYHPRRVLDSVDSPDRPRRAIAEPLPSRAGPSRSLPELSPTATAEPRRVLLPPVLSPVEPPLIDTPGQDAQARAEEELARIRRLREEIGALLASGLEASSDEPAPRTGADGEETVGERLEKLRADGWQLLHSIPTEGGGRIDHLLIGPGGVYTINAHTHPKATIWVSGTTVTVNGHRHPYLVQDSRFEAGQVARRLSSTVGRRVEVTAALVFLTDTHIPQVRVKDRPKDVLVLDRLDLPRHFRRQPTILAPAQVHQIFEAARKPSTWRGGRND